jgi:hypothetical protein
MRKCNTELINDMHFSDMSSLNCRANTSGICYGFEFISWYSFYLKQLRVKILKWHLKETTMWSYCRCGTNSKVVLNHHATDYSLLLAAL